MLLQGVHICTPVVCCNCYRMLKRWKNPDLNLFMYGFHVSRESKVRPSSLIVDVSFNSCPLRLRRMLVWCLMFAECYHYQFRAQKLEYNI